jgi:hypothetical protein
MQCTSVTSSLERQPLITDVGRDTLLTSADGRLGGGLPIVVTREQD